MAIVHKLLALGAAAAACALVAAPLSASESSIGDPKLGEKIFFDQAFSATPSSIVSARVTTPTLARSPSTPRTGAARPRAPFCSSPLVTA